MNGLFALTNAATQISDEELVGVFALIAAAGIGVILLVAIGYYVLRVIGTWRLFKKMGEPGWKSLIPVYSDYVLYKRVWTTNTFWVVLIVALVGGVASGLQQADVLPQVMGFLYSFAGFFSFIVNIMLMNNLRRSFGKGVGFLIGLILLGPIFLLILSFGSATYQGNLAEKK